MPLRTGPSRRPSPAAAAFSEVASRIAPEHLAVARTGIGATMVVRPRLLPRLLGVDSATSARMGWVTQMLGAREIALGVGALVALRSPDRRAARVWVVAGMLCDAADALTLTGALLKNRVSRPMAGAMAGAALGAVAMGSRVVDRADDEL